MNTSQSKLSLESLRAVTQKLLSTVNRLDRLVQSDEFLSYSSTLSAPRIKMTCVSSGPEISGIFGRRRDFVVYVSGPITAEHPYQREANIEKAKAWARALWSAGFTVICPQANTAYMGGIPNMEYEDWLDGDFIILDRIVNFAVFIDGWSSSVGCKLELQRCTNNKTPVFHTYDGMDEALRDMCGYADRIIEFCKTGRWE